MTALQVIEQARSLGVAVELKPPDRLRVVGPENAVASVRPLLADHKAAIVAELRRRESARRAISNESAREIADRIERALAGEMDPEREAEMRARWAAHDRACNCATLAEHFREGGSWDGASPTLRES